MKVARALQVCRETRVVQRAISIARNWVSMLIERAALSPRRSKATWLHASSLAVPRLTTAMTLPASELGPGLGLRHLVSSK
ncbi:MAG: hypothetical protein ABI298_04435 [Acidimicrobiales bacterium]